MFVLKCRGVTSLYVTLSCCLSIFQFVLFPGFPFLFLSSIFTVAGGVQIGRLACQSSGQVVWV